jgi:hypothetical protein
MMSTNPFGDLIMLRAVRIAMLFLLFVPAVVSARPFVVECPAALDASSKVSVVPKGWTAVPGETHFAFDNITVFDGQPMDRASLVPDRDLEESENGKTAVSEWLFPEGAKNIWFTCSYRGTPSSLAMKVSSVVLRCTTLSRRESWGWRHEPKIICE